MSYLLYACLFMVTALFSFFVSLFLFFFLLQITHLIILFLQSYLKLNSKSDFCSVSTIYIYNFIRQYWTDQMMNWSNELIDLYLATASAHNCSNSIRTIIIGSMKFVPQICLSINCSKFNSIDLESLFFKCSVLCCFE